MSNFEYVNCDLCGFDDTELIYKVPECTGMYPEEIFNLVKCKNCGLVYVNPRPVKKELLKYYPQETYYAYQNTENKKTNTRDKLKDIIIEYSGGYKSINNKFIDNIVKKISKYILLGNIPWRKDGKLLDIGCGNGGFLIWYRAHGWNVYGVEINKEAANICRQKGINVFNGELMDAHFKNDTFDVVTIIQVLEHLCSPSQVIKEIYRILKKDGLLLIGIPNFGSYDRKIFNADWLPLEVPRHLYHFEPVKLRNLLERYGFKIQELRAKGFYLYGFKNISKIKERTFTAKILLLIKLNLIKPIKMLFSSKRRDKFGILISLYCQK